MTPTQRKNLTKLAAHLESLPRNYNHFDMADFMWDEYGEVSDEQYVNYAKNTGKVTIRNCGAVACALGHGPGAGIPFRRCDLKKIGDGYLLDWPKYADQFAIQYSPNWDWMFSEWWTFIDNTHRGAAARIRFLLAGREIPGNYVENNNVKRLYKEFLV